MKLSILSIAIGLLMAGSATAADRCGTPDSCGHCGRRSVCNKVCRVVCEMKKVTKVVWTVECDEFCAPLPGCGHGCGSCGDACGCGEESCDSCAKDACAELRSRPLVAPKCGKVRCRKTLVKKEITCEVPAYKCVVEFRCPGCEADCSAEEATPAAAPQQAPVSTPATTLMAPLPPLVSGVGYLRQLD
jgi:hypothetical protein